MFFFNNLLIVPINNLVITLKIKKLKDFFEKQPTAKNV